MVFFAPSRWIAPVLLAAMIPSALAVPSFFNSNKVAAPRAAVEKRALPLCNAADLLDLKAALDILGIDLGACVALGLDKQPSCILPNCGQCPSSSSSAPAPPPTSSSTKAPVSSSTTPAAPSSTKTSATWGTPSSSSTKLASPSSSSTKAASSTTPAGTKTSTSPSPTSTSACDTQALLQVVATIKALGLKIQAILGVLDGKNDPTQPLIDLTAAIKELSTYLQGIDISILICGQVITLLANILTAILNALGLYKGKIPSTILINIDIALQGLFSVLSGVIKALGPSVASTLKGLVGVLNGLGLTGAGGLLGGLLGSLGIHL